MVPIGSVPIPRNRTVLIYTTQKHMSRGGGDRVRTGAGAVEREGEVRERKGKVVCLVPVIVFGFRTRIWGPNEVITLDLRL